MTRRRDAFTLVELMLVVGLLAVLAAVTYFSMAGWQTGATFEEGVQRFEAMLRMARADAANQGFRIRLTSDDAGRVRILCEAQPRQEPEQFIDYPGCSWSDFSPHELARITRSELTGPSAYQTLSREGPAAANQAAAPMDALTFYPDGSSDSALVELTPLDETDTRRAVVELDGLSGRISTTIVQIDELELLYTQLRQQQSGQEPNE